MKTPPTTTALLSSILSLPLAHRQAGVIRQTAYEWRQSLKNKSMSDRQKEYILGKFGYFEVGGRWKKVSKVDQLRKKQYAKP